MDEYHTLRLFMQWKAITEYPEKADKSPAGPHVPGGSNQRNGTAIVSTRLSRL
jgi:hypothetical protein